MPPNIESIREKVCESDSFYRNWVGPDGLSKNMWTAGTHLIHGHTSGEHVFVINIYRLRDRFKHLNKKAESIMSQGEEHVSVGSASVALTVM